MRKLLLAFVSASIAVMIASPALATARIDPGRPAAHPAVKNATTAHLSIALGERGDRPADGTIAFNLDGIDNATAGGLANST